MPCCGPARQCSPVGTCVAVPPPDAGSWSGPENTNARCSDGWDNDGDGFVDCVDWNCCKEGVPAAGVTACQRSSCAPTFVPSCLGDDGCPRAQVCEVSAGLNSCVSGCHDASRCLPDWVCVQMQCLACPCPGRCEPPFGTTVTIDDRVHHLGDGPGNEGVAFARDFLISASFSQASLELDFPGGPGPNLERPPSLAINGSPAPPIVSFFPPLDPTRPWWQTNPDGSHGCNRAFHVSVPVGSLLKQGSNSFQIWSGRGDDDYLFSNVLLWLK